MAKKEKKEPKDKALETELEKEVEKEEIVVEEEKTAKKEKKKKEKNKEGYFKLLREQMKKVIWPSGKDMFKYTFSTILFILVFVLFFQLIDVISSFVKGLF